MDNDENRRFEDYSDPRVTNLNGEPYSPYEADGNPLKNHFGAKLTFSIIAIVIGALMFIGSAFWGVFFLGSAVMACIFTCLQNRDYRVGNWQLFRRNRTLATIFLSISLVLDVLFLILVVIVVIVAVVEISNAAGGHHSSPDSIIEEIIGDNNDDYDGDDGNFGDDGDDTDDTDDTHGDTDFDVDEFGINNLEGGYVDMVAGYNAFELMGADVTLPMPVQDFMDAGFYLNDEDLNETIEAHNSYGYAYYSQNGDQYLGTIFAYNVKGHDVKVKNCTIGGITISQQGDVDLKMVGGITFGSSPKEAIKVFGTGVTSVEGEGSNRSYSWLFSHGYSTSVELDYRSNKLEEVWIMNYDTLSDY